MSEFTREAWEQHPDEYQYDLVVRAGGDEKALRFTESTVPGELSPLVRALEQRAEDELRRRAGR